MNSLAKTVLLCLSLFVCTTDAVAPTANQTKSIGDTGCKFGCAKKPKTLEHLGVCALAGPMGNLTVFKTCAAKVNSTLCATPANTCTWVPLTGAGATQFGNTGLCLPSNLAPSVTDSTAAFTDYATIVETALPAIADVLPCLNSVGCMANATSSGCVACGNLPNATYPGIPSLCLPRALHTAYCASIQNITTFTDCPVVQRNATEVEAEKKKAMEVMVKTACAAGCTYKPKNLAQTGVCLGATHIADLSATATALTKCGEKKLMADCKDSCAWLAPNMTNPADGGSCFPKEFATVAKEFAPKIDDIAPLADGAMPDPQLFFKIFTCLTTNTKESCPTGTCTFCDGISKDMYPRTVPLTGLCLPNTGLPTTVCAMIKQDATKLEKCMAAAVVPTPSNKSAASPNGAPLIACIAPLVVLLMFHN
jgi:hypothetical protein